VLFPRVQAILGLSLLLGACSAPPPAVEEEPAPSENTRPREERPDPEPVVIPPSRAETPVAPEVKLSAEEIALNDQRALLAGQNLMRRFWTLTFNSLAMDPTLQRSSELEYWITAQALDALLDLAERTRGRRFFASFEAVYATRRAAGLKVDFYDDENWMALALIRAFDISGERRFLTDAEELLVDIIAAWDTTCCGSSPGGVWWDRAHSQKATASNAGPIITAVRMFQRTQNAAYLEFARKVYAYWRANMVNPTSFQVLDHISPSGLKTAWKFTYNEGLMIGAALALNDATGEASFLDDAHRYAKFMLAQETAGEGAARILTDGTNTSCTGSCMAFKGIGARYLAQLFKRDRTRGEYLDVLRASAKSIVEKAQTPDGLFATDWAGPPQPVNGLEAQVSATMALGTLALLAPPMELPAGWIYEAEEGILNRVGIGSNGTFQGWGYVDGWNREGASLGIRVEVPEARAYDVELTFAAGAGQASRAILINDATAVPNLFFPSTGDWNSYATVTTRVSLPKGVSVLKVSQQAGLGSANFVNLDRLILR
jgi:predicted alpha-1,6-mannanase (GH76 family)